MRRTVIVGSARTPFGKFGGALKDYSAVELGSIALKEVVNRSNIEPDDIELVMMGQVISGGCGQIPGRQASIMAGIPKNVPVDQINKVCASSLRAVTLADTIIRAGDANIIATGGMESMSNAPFAVSEMRWGHRMFDSSMSDLMVKDGLWCPSYNVHMAVHGGTVALENGITRQMQDEWAVESQRRAKEAVAKGYLDREIISIEKPNGIMNSDESPRPGTTIDDLKKLKPLFSDGNTVTAGNAPGVNDGASANILMSEDEAMQRCLEPEAFIIGHAMCSEDPVNIATAPGHAINRLLEKYKMAPSDIDLYEINEAFAAVTLLSAQIVDIDLDRVNVNGGAIAYGHPLGASGGRIVMTLINELQRRNLKYGIAAICSGMGQGDALLIENAKYS